MSATMWRCQRWTTAVLVAGGRTAAHMAVGTTVLDVNSDLGASLEISDAQGLQGRKRAITGERTCTSRRRVSPSRSFTCGVSVAR